ncbi:alcohol dehydrogenase catalytic domain-containing protein, partial [Streptomyces sp. NPDC000931]
MRAIVIEEYGGPEVLRLTEAESPAPGPGEALVDVEARGVNFIDVYQRSGAYRVPLPYVPGMEAAGTVSALGEGVTDLRVGQRVAWAMAPGGYADQAVVRASLLVPVPDAVSTEQAAALMLQGMTAHYLTHAVHPVAEGETVLVHAAAGGTGLLVTQLAKARGARVIGTVSTDEKERIAREAGADEIIR